MTAEEAWAEQLAAWAIPEEIRSQASDDPWKLSPNLLPPPGAAGPDADDSPSRLRALEALGDGGTVVDVGVGAGAASLPLAPPATQITGVDENPEMLDAFKAHAAERGVAVKTFPGAWNDVARAVPVADVVVCHHVFYNVPDLRPFAQALTAHARRRVVVELGARHPVAGSNPLWKHFWDLDRPEGPTADDAVAVLEEAGIEPTVERAVRPRVRRADPEVWAAFLARRLCLPPERLPEVKEAMARWPE
ncbi:MAG: class I SAM-dependent methyltransferase, partial [Acidimicrobiales bacterium]